MVLRACLVVLALAVGCNVDTASGFTGVSGGSATTAPTTTVAVTTGDDDSTGDSSDTGDGAGSGDTTSDTTPADGSTSEPTTGGADDASTGNVGDTSSEASSGGGEGSPLDPELDIPNGGEQCTSPGSLDECPGISVCRFATVEYGLCESCDNCGNLNAPCTEGTDCDILFMCYAGACTNFCTLDTYECGPVEDCLDIGHPTRGVCNPFA